MPVPIQIGHKKMRTIRPPSKKYPLLSYVSAVRASTSTLDLVVTVGVPNGYKATVSRQYAPRIRSDSFCGRVVFLSVCSALPSDHLTHLFDCERVESFVEV
jgi:hypothetical protein